MPDDMENTSTEENRPRAKIDKRVAKIMRSKGRTYKEIAEHFGTTEQVIKNYFYNESKKSADAEQNKRPPGRPKGSRNKRTLAEEAMLADWEKNKLAPMMREDKAELNRAAGYFVAQCWRMGQTVDPNDIESLYNGLMRYVELCTQTGMPMLVKTCHLALGLQGATITRWKNGTYRSNDPRYKEFAEVLEAVIGAGMESAAAAGSIDRVLTIWWQKAHFNMVEGSGVQAEPDDPLGQRVKSEDIIKKYGNLPD